MMVGNRVSLRTAFIAGSIFLFVGLLHAGDTPKQAAPSAGDKTKQAAPLADDKSKPAAPSADDKTKQAAPLTDDKSKPAAPSAGNKSKPTASPAGNKSKPTASPAGNKSKPTASPAGNKSKPTAPPAGKKSKPTAPPAGNKSKAPANPIEVFYTWLEPTGTPDNRSTVLMAFRDAEGRPRVTWWLPQEDGKDLSQIDGSLWKALYSQFQNEDAKDSSQHSLNTFLQALREQKTQQELLKGPLDHVSIQPVVEARPRAPIRTTDLLPAWNDLFGQSTRNLSILQVETKDFGQIKIAATKNLLLLKRATSRPGESAGSETVIDLEAAAVELLAAMAKREKTVPLVVDLRFLTEGDMEGDCLSVKQQLAWLLSQPASLEAITRRKNLPSVILSADTVPGRLVPNPVGIKSQWTLSNQSLKEENLAEIFFKGQNSGSPTLLLKDASIPACGQAKLSVFLLDGKKKTFFNDWNFYVDPQRIKPGAWRLTIIQKESNPRIAASRASVVNGEIQVELERFGARHLFSKLVDLGVSALRVGTPWLWMVGLTFGSAAALLGLVWLGRASWHRWWRKVPEPTPAAPSTIPTASNADSNSSTVDAIPVEAAKSGEEVPVETRGTEPYEPTADTVKPQASPPASDTAEEPVQQLELGRQLESLREERDKIKRELREKEGRYVSATGESKRLRTELSDQKEKFTAQKNELKAKTEQIKSQRKDLEAKDKRFDDAQSEKKRLAEEITKLTSALEKQKNENTKLQKAEKDLSDKVKAWQAALQRIGSNPEDIAKRWDRETGWLKTVTDALQGFFQTASATETAAAFKDRSPERLSDSLDNLGKEVHEGRALVEEILHDLANEQGVDGLVWQEPGMSAGEIRLAYRKLQQQRAAIDRVRKLNPRIANVVWVIEGIRELGEWLARMAADPGARLLTGTLLEPAQLATALQGIAEKSEDRWNEMLRAVAGLERVSKAAVSQAFESFLDWFLDGERLQALTNTLRLAQVVSVYCEGASDPEIEEFHNRFIGYYDECVELQKRFNWMGVQLAPLSFFKPPKTGEGWAFHENGDSHPLIFESYALKKLAVNKAVTAGEDVTRTVGDVSTWGFRCDDYQELRSDTRGWLCRGWRTL